MAHYLPEGKRTFAYDPKSLNAFLYQQREHHPELLESFKFDWRGKFPRSDELSSAIANMLQGGLVTVSSQTIPQEYQFSPECETQYQKHIKPIIPAEKLSEIEKIAAAFNKQVSITQTTAAA